MTTENSSQESASTSAGSSDSGSSSQESGTQNPISSTPQSASATDAASTQGSAAPQLGPDGKPVAPVYQPNFKFKAFGKEHEIEEIYRGLIKDKDTEEKIRKLHEKAFAMEPFQNESKKFKTELEQFKAQTEPNMRAMNHFNNLLKNKDWDNFFGGLKVPEEEIFNWVQKRLDLRAMPAEQRAEFERQAQIRQQNYQYENELSETQQQYQQLATETRSMQLDNVLARQEIQSQADQIDRAYGQPGAFRNLVIEEAMNHYHRTQQDLPADQAVQMTVQKYSRFLAAQNQSVVAPPSMQVQAAAPQGTTQGQAPIIPHVGGSARSPVKKSPRSLDDVKKLAKEAAAREQQNY